MSAADGARHASWGALVLSHIFIAWSAAASGLRMEDVAWLYWSGSFFLVASIIWRMRLSPVVTRLEAGIVLAFLGMLQWLAAEILARNGYAMAWNRSVAIALPWIFANTALDLRRHLKFDELESPSFVHFLILWFARSVPFALIFVLPLAFPGRILHGGPAPLLAFLACVAGIDVALHLAGPSFGRQLTRWQQKRQAKSSNAYLKWYRPAQRKD